MNKEYYENMLYTCDSHSNSAANNSFQFPSLLKLLGKISPHHYIVKVDFPVMVLHSSWTKIGHISHSRPVLVFLEYWLILFQNGYLSQVRPKKYFGGLNRTSEEIFCVCVYVCVLLKFLCLQRWDKMNVNL